MVGRILTLVLLSMTFTSIGCQDMKTDKDEKVEVAYDNPTTGLPMAQQAINLPLWGVWMVGGRNNEVKREATSDIRVHNYHFPDGSYVIYQKLPEGTERAWAVNEFGAVNATGVFVTRGGLHYKINKSDILEENNVAFID